MGGGFVKNFFKGNLYLKISLYAVFVIIMSILFYRVSSNTDNIMPSIVAFFDGIIGVITPILYAFLIAYLFNPIMIFFERYFLKWFKPKTVRQTKSIRTLSIFSVYICIIGSIILMIRFLLPQITENLKDLITALPAYAKSAELKLNEFEATINASIATLPYQLDTSQLFTMIEPSKYFDKDFVGIVVTGIMGSAMGITSSLFNWIMGLVIAFYILTQKESFAFGTKRMVYTLLSKPKADRLIAILSEGHQVFIQFFIGKFIDSFIIGAICFIGLSILKNPYAVLLALIVGVTNMIPYFGPLIGAIPAVVITFFTGFMPAVAVGIFIFLLQQFDGLVLGPKILGDSIGLSPFWIISGILVGGALWGPLGMFFASPIIAVILNNINRWMDRVLSKKDIVLKPLLIESSSTPPPTLKKEKNKSSKSK